MERKYHHIAIKVCDNVGEELEFPMKHLVGYYYEPLLLLSLVTHPFIEMSEIVYPRGMLLWQIENLVKSSYACECLRLFLCY
jgi:hypothetical protein